MAKNKVKQFRTQQKLSQRDLAERAGTSQQQIQRIESGTITTSLDTARAIAAALQKPFEAVFPDAAKALSEFQAEIKRTHSVGDEDLQKVSQAGIEADVSAWYFKIRLEGVDEARIIQVAPEEKRRLYKAVQGESDSGLSFVLFDSPTHRIALNLGQLVACQFLMEPFGAPEVEPDEEDGIVRICPVGGNAPIELEVEPDEPDDSDGIGQLGHIFFMLELGADASDRYRIVDDEGEDAFVRAGSIATFEVPLSLLTEPLEDEAED